MPAKSVLPQCPIPSCKSIPANLRFHVVPGKPVESSWGVITRNVVIHECPSCGLLFRSVEGEATLQEFYGAEYHMKMIGAGDTPHKRLNFARQENEDRIHYLKSFCPRGKVLDIGCSTGVFASQLKEAGYEVSGVDISAYACDMARKALTGSVKIFCGKIEDLDEIPDKHYDAVTLLDVIEHFHDIVSPLRAIYRVLLPGGVLFIRTPSAQSLFFLAARLAYHFTAGIVKSPLVKIYHAEHLYFFNASNMKRLLQDTGFELLDVRPDHLLWRNFRAAELNQGPIVNSALAILYASGRCLRIGHGMKIIARKTRNR